MTSFAKKASGIASRMYNPEAELKGIHQDTSGLAASIERALNEAHAQAYQQGWHGGIRHYIDTRPKNLYQEPLFQGVMLLLMIIGVPLLMIALFR